ncbi:MAG: SUMF1/EgtB/PvdO family nonheme iron enzyme [Chloroherpetonaceae bacterium]|nr:SUMF1/EgtB/PvdO family nonheme iron enzyme [Chloroherpetonaceae bacterium]
MKIENDYIRVGLVFLLLLIISCQIESPSSKGKLEVVTHHQFQEFVKETGYVTDADKFGWSIVQKDLFDFSKVVGANWRKPDGRNEPLSEDLPVTQFSYNDAMAYCKWSGSRLPSYE